MLSICFKLLRNTFFCPDVKPFYIFWCKYININKTDVCASKYAKRFGIRAKIKYFIRVWNKFLTYHVCLNVRFFLDNNMHLYIIHTLLIEFNYKLFRQEFMCSFRICWLSQEKFVWCLSSNLLSYFYLIRFGNALSSSDI